MKSDGIERALTSYLHLSLFPAYFLVNKASNAMNAVKSTGTENSLLMGESRYTHDSES